MFKMSPKRRYIETSNGTLIPWPPQQSQPVVSHPPDPQVSERAANIMAEVNEVYGMGYTHYERLLQLFRQDEWGRWVILEEDYLSVRPSWYY
jgi:hypothetical protein